MARLSVHTEQLIASYKYLHAKSLKRTNPNLYQYFDRINKDHNWFKGKRFQTRGEIIHILLIEKLQQMKANHDAVVLDQVIDILMKDNGSLNVQEIDILKAQPHIAKAVNETPKLSELLNEYAKMNDIFRRLRSIEYSQFDQMENKGIIADDFGYTLRTLYEQGCTEKEVQEMIDKTNFTPSLTSHPTNPQSVEYVEVAMDLVDVITDSESSKKQINQAIDKLTSPSLKATPDKNKTQDLEIDEVLLYLKRIYRSLDGQYKTLEDAIKEFNKFPNIELSDDFNHICVWVAGDGDGNPNATPESLQSNINKFRKAIKEEYFRDLVSMTHNLGDIDHLGAIALLNDFKNGVITNAEKFIDAIKSYIRDDDPRKIPLIRKVSTFGFHFAKIDIRHTAVDLVKVREVIDQAFDSYKDFIRAQDNKSELSDQEVRQEILKEILDGSIDLSKIGVDENSIEMTQRIAGRFVVAAKDPIMFEKAIVAEFNDPEQISAVLQLLRDTGHKVAQEGASLNIVPLAESRDNLKKLNKDIEVALNNDEYFEHVKHTQKIYFMIARSDTVRRNGCGAQDSQEEAITKSIHSIANILIQKVIDRNLSEEDLKNFQIIPYSGGGNALQRGGGKMTELPSVYGRYCFNALDSLEHEILSQRDSRKMELLKVIRGCVKEPCLTTQGHQNAIFYQEGVENCGKRPASFISQSIYARARTNKKIENKGIDLKSLQTIYNERIQSYINAAIKDFSEIHIGKIISLIEKSQKTHSEFSVEYRIGEDLITAAKYYYAQYSKQYIGAHKDNTLEQKRLEEVNKKIKKEFSDLLNRKRDFASQSVTAISDIAVAEYAIHVGSEEAAEKGESSPVDKLLNKIGPWYFTKMGNVSSRANKRGQEEVEKDKTFIQLKGRDPKVLLQRAIGVESVSTHSGSGVIAFIGWRNAIFKHFGIDISKDISDFTAEQLSQIQEVFCCSKSFRDLMRSAEMSIAQTDYEKSWATLYDKEQIHDEGIVGNFRPSELDIKGLHDKYITKLENGALNDVTEEETLGFLDYQANQTKQLIQIIAGNRSTCPEFTAEEIKFKRECQVATNLESAITHYGNKHSDELIFPELKYLMKSIYAATDCEAKPGLLIEPARIRKDKRSSLENRGSESSISSPDKMPPPAIVATLSSIAREMSHDDLKAHPGSAPANPIGRRGRKHQTISLV